MSFLSLVLLAVPVEAKPKDGVVLIRTQPAGMQLSIDGQSMDVTGLDFREHRLPAGLHEISIILPDGNQWTHSLQIKNGKTCQVEVIYSPPTIVKEPVREVEKEIIKEPCPEIPETPKEKQFDVCCGCKRDDLKARLDVFAVELQREPRRRGRIVGTSFALDYLLNQRKLTGDRVELITREGNCTELWILP
jgi:hypothetical protein